MGDEGGAERHPIRISDNVIMGDLTISAEATELIKLDLPVNEEELNEFIENNWVVLINKFGTEKIPIEYHQIVIFNVTKQLLYKCGINSDSAFLKIAKEITTAMAVDVRTISSRQIHLELEVLRAITIWKENDFKSFERILSKVLEYYQTSDVEEESILGVFQLFRSPDFAFLHSDENTYESYDFPELLVMLATDAVCEFCFIPEFIKIHCLELLNILQKNHGYDSRLISIKKEYPLWKKIRIDLVCSYDGDYIWEHILLHNSFTIFQFEDFLRLLLKEGHVIFGAEHQHSDYRWTDSGDYVERFYLIKNSIKSITSKIESLSQKILENNAHVSLQQTLARSLFDWFELLVFITTMRDWLHYKDALDYSYRGLDDNDENTAYHHINQFCNTFFSILDSLNQPPIISFLQDDTNLQSRMFGAANSLNATYCRRGWGPYFLYVDQHDFHFFNSVFNFQEVDYGTSNDYAQFQGRTVFLKPDYMPRWWQGTPYLDCHPDYEKTYSTWLDGTDLRKIQIPESP